MSAAVNDARLTAAHRLIARASTGQQSRPVQVALLGAAIAPSLPTDEWWALRDCLFKSVSTLLGRQDYGALDLRQVTLTEPALLFQRVVYQGPLKHYLEHSSEWDPTSPALALPVVFRVQGRWIVADGTHRYIADLLMGRAPSVFAVRSVVPCFCNARRERTNPWNTDRPVRPRVQSQPR